MRPAQTESPEYLSGISTDPAASGGILRQITFSGNRASAVASALLR